MLFRSANEVPTLRMLNSVITITSTHIQAYEAVGNLSEACGEHEVFALLEFEASYVPDSPTR